MTISERGYRRLAIACGVVLALALIKRDCVLAESAFSRERPERPAVSLTREHGEATYYHDRYHGRPMACGGRYDREQLTAAHNHLPCGTRVRVCRTDRRSLCVDVEITDRGPFARTAAGGYIPHPTRIIDLSHEGARRLGMIESGVVGVTVEVVK